MALLLGSPFALDFPVFHRPCSFFDSPLDAYFDREFARTTKMLSKFEKQATKEFDRLFGQFNILNNDNKGELEVKVPESVADPQNLSIEVKNGMLCVSAQKNSDGYSSHFTYRTTLPENVEAENIKAHWDNETKVLKFLLPSKPKEEQKSIQIPDTTTSQEQEQQQQQQVASESQQEEMEVEQTTQEVPSKEPEQSENKTEHEENQHP
jgi:HSP20 family molecular chaperone IbpA